MTAQIAEELGRIPMSPRLSQTLRRAADYASAQSHAEVTIEHLLLSLTEDTDAEGVLTSSNVAIAALKSDVSQNLTTLERSLPDGHTQAQSISAQLRRILEAAAAAAQGRRSEINGAIVLAAIVGDGTSSAAHILRAHGLTFEEAIRALQQPAATPPPAPAPRPADPPTAQAEAGPREAPLTQGTADDILADARSRVASRKREGLSARLEAPALDHMDRLEAEIGRDESLLDEGEPLNETIPQPLPRERPADAPVTTAPPSPAQHEAGVPPSSPAAAQPPPGPAGPPRAQPSVHHPPSQDTSWAPPPPAQPRAPQQPRPQRPPPPMPADPLPAGYNAPRPAPPPRGQPGLQTGTHPAGQGAAGGIATQPRPPAAAPTPAPGQHPSAPPWSETPTAGGPARRPPAPGAPSPQPQARRPQAPPGAQPGAAGHPPRARQAIARRSPALEAGQVVENIPRTMRVGVPTTAEVRIAKADVKALAEGLEGGGTAYRHDVLVTKAMSVRLRAPEGGFFIETASPETQWIENALGLMADDFASWRWTVTPRLRGRKRLQLVVAARTVGADGVAAETALPDQVIDVRVRINYAKTARSWIGWITAAIIGGLLARFGEQIWDSAQAIIKSLQAG